MSDKKGSRLERLFTLLDGRNMAHARASAQQLGQVVAYHPHELQKLLFRVRLLLHSPRFDSRVAAGLAIERIAEQVSWTSTLGSPATTTEPLFRVQLRFSGFSVKDVIAKGEALLSSGGEEFDVDWDSMDMRKRIALQKKDLLRRIGMENEAKIGGFDENEWVGDKDFLAVTSSSAKGKKSSQVKAEDVMEGLEESELANMSARERNRAKRLAKQKKKKQKVQTFSEPSTKGKDSGTVKVEEEDPEQWPFTRICDQLLHDLFDRNWVVRHGAAIGLRSILKTHAESAGHPLHHLDPAVLHARHTQWVEDVCVRLLIIFSLDRFADYSSGQAIAPVREECSKVLGFALRYAAPEIVIGAAKALLDLEQGSSWEHRHSGFVGLKYVLAVRKDLACTLLDTILPALLRGIEDRSDDVRLAVADSLLSAVDEILSSQQQHLPALLLALWNTLLELDDLTSSTTNIMNVLSQFYASGDLMDLDLGLSFDTLVPRMFPFFRHDIVSVRSSCLSTLLQLLSTPGSAWVPAIFPQLLHMLFQNILLESHEEVLELSYRCWTTLLANYSSCLGSDNTVTSDKLDENNTDDSNNSVSKILKLLCTPSEAVLPSEFLLHTSAGGSVSTGPVVGDKRSRSDTQHQSLDPLVSTIAMRVRGAKALGALLSVCPAPGLIQALQTMLTSLSMAQRVSAGISISEWYTLATAPVALETLDLFPLLISNLAFKGTDSCGQDWEELQYYRTKLTEHTRALLKLCAPVLPDTPSLDTSTASLELVNLLIDDLVPKAIPRAGEAEASKLAILSAAASDTLSAMESCFVVSRVSVAVSAAEGLISSQCPMEKLGAVIAPLMTSLKKERNPVLQDRAASATARLITQCIGRSPCPNDKILKKLLISGTERRDERSGPEAETDLRSTPRRGLRALLRDLGAKLGDSFLTSVPFLWTSATSTLGAKYPTSFDAVIRAPHPKTSDDEDEEIFAQLQILLYIFQDASPIVRKTSLSILPAIFECLKHTDAHIRMQAARNLVSLAAVMLPETMEYLIAYLIPILENFTDTTARIGACYTIRLILDQLGVAVVPYLSFFVIPLLGRMSDPDPSVRADASLGFATAVKLIPLESGSEAPVGMSKALRERKATESVFLDQLLDPRKIPDYVPQVPVKAQLRRYQQEGVNWLAFLHRFNLHGILCDDMGLGKTLQTLCVVASDIHTRRQRYSATKALDSAPLPSLVVCPSTLVNHWCYEISKFFDEEHVFGIPYNGSVADRTLLRRGLSSRLGDNLLVISYSVLKRDFAHFKDYRWNYCILDEGHTIKNPSSGISKAVKNVRANRRLILSGTPIQNNVVEMWSLFDFLMPSYLGEYSYFKRVFAKPISESQSVKAKSGAQERGALALETLRRQVLTFVMRRMKEDVLDDLPPKILQDVICDLSSLQVKLYESFGKSRVVQEDISVELATAPGRASQHIFQALQYLLKLCNHPKLVLDASHPDLAEVMTELQSNNQALTDITLSPKIMALKDLLGTCGIGQDPEKDEEESLAASQHRVLIFSRTKAMLDVVEHDLFKPHMPSVSYLRLDGNVAAEKRFAIVTEFNEDPTIDVLLLTTSVGGQGLNLTGADTVIFLDHSWNPTVDLQAMDRAHRLGQKRTVNVYRLIMKNSVEEKQMSLQKFKTGIANAVITQDNASLSTMGTDNVLDLFTLGDETGKGDQPDGVAMDVDGFGNPVFSKTAAGVKGVLEGLGELWDESQYDDYNLADFVKDLQ